MNFPLDQPVRLPWQTFSDPAHTVLADPTEVTLTLRNPDGSPASADWPSGAISRDSLGTFHYDVTEPVIGYYSGHWKATGAVATSLDIAFSVVAAKYLLVSDLRLALAGANLASGTAASLTDDDLFDAISEAQAEVDARLSDRYPTPFTQPPDIVVAVTRDIAGYLATMTARRGETIGPQEPVFLRYQRAQTILSQIVAGSFPLGIPGSAPGQQEATSTGPAVVNGWDGDLWSPADFALTQQPGWPTSRWPLPQ